MGPRGTVPSDHLVQVAYSIASDHVRTRELRALAKSASYLGAKTATVVTANEEETIAVDGVPVRVLPMWKWLLAPLGEP